MRWEVGGVECEPWVDLAVTRRGLSLAQGAANSLHHARLAWVTSKLWKFVDVDGRYWEPTESGGQDTT